MAISNPTYQTVCFRVRAAIDPKDLILNTYDITPKIDPDEYRLTIA